MFLLTILLWVCAALALPTKRTSTSQLFSLIAANGTYNQTVKYSNYSLVLNDFDDVFYGKIDSDNDILLIPGNDTDTEYVEVDDFLYTTTSASNASKGFEIHKSKLLYQGLSKFNACAANSMDEYRIYTDDCPESYLGYEIDILVR